MADRDRNKRLVIGLVVLAALSALLFFRSQMQEGQGSSDQVASSGKAGSGDDANGGAGAAGKSGRREEKGLHRDDAAKDAEAAQYLRDQFGATISNKRTQIKTIEKLINYLMERYPGEWEQHMQALLAMAFPDMADELYAQYQNMTAYNDWLKANRTALNQMSHDERMAALHDARMRYFGTDADEIFEEANRNESIGETLHTINDDHQSTVGDKLGTYIESINEAYGDQAPQFLERRQTELMTKFLSLPSVQEDLHAMTAEQREQQLDQIRAKMGLDDSARERWRNLDAERDQSWDSGERYMQERDQITKQYQGDDQAQRLQELRARYFPPDEADVIRDEEQSGFFRFGHSRMYGKE